MSDNLSLQQQKDAIEAQVASERSAQLNALPTEGMDPLAVAQMTHSFNSYWDNVLAQRLAACQQQHQQEEARQEQLRARAEAEAKEKEEAERRLQADIEAASRLKDLVGPLLPSASATTKDKDADTVIEMAIGRAPSTSVSINRPSETVLKKIKKGDYTFPLWHLTTAGCERAQQQRSDGSSNLKIDGGEIRVRDDLKAPVADEDLDHAQWTGASQMLIHWAKAMGRPSAEVTGLVTLHASLQSYPGYADHTSAFQEWHKKHRQAWFTSHLDSPDGKRTDLGVINKQWWEELHLKSSIKKMEVQAKKTIDMAIQSTIQEVAFAAVQAAVTAVGGRKRAAADEAGPSNWRRQNFRPQSGSPSSATTRCLMCGSRDFNHQRFTCTATSRVDGRQQVITRSVNNKIIFKEDKVEPCLGYNTGSCKFAKCKRAHRCTLCGINGHGDSNCPSGQ
ncbi:hypothetical protein OC835_002950 [Tilletia horrida]|nr:hypothetical protein OC835_002950 [Tilletia horrida]